MAEKNPTTTSRLKPERVQQKLKSERVQGQLRPERVGLAAQIGAGEGAAEA